MKQKVVLNVSLHFKKKLPCYVFAKLTTHSKALEIAAGLHGVQSVAWQGEDKSKLEVTGEDIDLILLIKMLKKKIGHTKIVSVEEKKEEKKDEKDKEENKPEFPAVVWHPVGFPQYPYYYDVPYSNPGTCSIL